MYLFWTKNQTGNKYYCLGENKKVNGKSVRVKEIYIGTADKLHELLYSKKDLDKINTYEYGLTVALLQEISKCGLYKILKEVLPFKIRGVPASIAVIILMLNKIIDPKTKNSFSQWYRNSVICKLLPINPDTLSSQFFFELLRELDEKKINRIEYRMAKNTKKIEMIDSILCDMTHIETYIGYHKNNKLPQRGRTRIKTGRRIVNLALLITRNNSIPLFHIPYPGNINDVTEFTKIIRLLEKRFDFLTGHGKKKLTILIDKGNNSEDNLNGLEDVGYYFVGRLKPSDYPELLAKPLSEFKDEYDDKEGVISYSLFKKVYGKRRKLVVKYDKESYEKSYGEFMDLIERRKQEIQELEDTINYKLKYGSKNSKTYWKKKEHVQKAVKSVLNKNPTKYLFTYNLSHNEGRIDVEIEINQEEYDKRINLIGKYILFTNRTRWTHNEIIKAFVDQYLIEDQYKKLKSERIKIEPPHHWTDASIRGDISLSILSLRVMNLFLMKAKKKVELSNNEILDTLENIRVSYYRLKEGKDEFDMVNEMDANEKQLYNKLKLKAGNTISYLKRAMA